MSIIERGYTIPFTCRRQDVPRYHAHQNGKGCLEHAEWLRQAIPELLEVGAIEAVPTRPHVVALVNVLPKSSPGKFRLIVDLRPLNYHVRERPFKYETHATFRDLIEADDDFISFDFASGYYHVDVAPEDRTFLGFRLFGQFYQFAVLPFGLRDACYVFTEVVKVPVRQLRTSGFRVLAYLDDLLLALQQMSQRDANAARAILEQLGFLLNLDKCVMSPTKRIENLGLVVDSQAMTYELTAKRLAKFQDAEAALRGALEADGVVRVRDVARITGHAAAASIVLERRARLYTRFLNDAIRDSAAARNWSAVVPLGLGPLAELAIWREILGSLGSPCLHHL